MVEKYYTGIKWTDPRDVKKVLSVYEDILLNIEEQLKLELRDELHKSRLNSAHTRFIKLLQKDGLIYDGKAILMSSTSNIEFSHEAQDLLDPHQFNEYVDRIRISIDSDPALAIGSTKELVESVLKTVLTHLDGVNFEKDDDIPKLLKKAQKALKLAPDDIDNAVKGVEIIKILLSNLGSIVIKLTELRNLYGTGHGAERKRTGMEPRHAKLAVDAGITLSSFLLATFRNRFTD